MKCFHDWARECWNEEDYSKINKTVTGASETYRFMCNDTDFKRDFFKHKGCYKKVAAPYDVCVQKFMTDVEKTMSAQDHSFSNTTVCW